MKLRPDQLPPSPHYRFETITDGVHMALAIEGGGAFANSGIVDLGDQTLIFDTSVSPQAARDLILAAQKLTDRSDIQYAVNSHYHRDHVRGNSTLPRNTTIISTTKTRDLMRSLGQQQLKSDAENIKTLLQRTEHLLTTQGSLLPKSDHLDLVFIAGWQRAVMESISKLKLRLPDITFGGRLVLRGSARRVELLSFADGHTPGDCMMYLPDDGIAFVADLLYVKRHAWLGECDTDSLLSILDLIEALELEHVAPGHGPLARPDAFHQARQYVNTVVRLVDEVLASGGSVEDAAALTRPSAFSNWRFGLMLWEDNMRALYSMRARRQERLA